jgi:hypothetical protein
MVGEVMVSERIDRKTAFELALKFCGITKYAWAKEHRTWPGLINGIFDGSRKSKRVSDEIDSYTVNALIRLRVILEKMDFTAYCRQRGI